MRDNPLTNINDANRCQLLFRVIAPSLPTATYSNRVVCRVSGRTTEGQLPRSVGFVRGGVGSAASASRRLPVYCSSRLQLAFELVQEAPIRAVGDDLLRARFDHTSVAHAQCIEADRVLGVVVAPFLIRNAAQRLEGIVIPRSEPAIDEPLRGPRRFAGAEFGGLE